MKKQLERILLLLTQTDPLTEQYDRLLTQYVTVYRIIKETSDIEIAVTDSTAVPTPEPQEAEPQPATESSPTKAKRKTNTTEEAPVTGCTAEYVRELLSEVSRGGTPIQPIVKKYTPEGKPVKFSSVPADKYPELVEELKTYAG